MASKLTEAKEGLGKDDVQVLDYEVMKGLLGDQHVGKKLSLLNHQMFLSTLLLMLPNGLRRTVSVRLLMLSSYNARKPVDNSLSSRKAYSRYDYHSTMSVLFMSILHGCRHDGGPDAADIPSDIPVHQLKELMLQFYNTQIVVNEEKSRLIQFNTMHHSQDDNESVSWITERRKRITSSNVKEVYKRRPTTPVAPLVHRFLYSTFRGNVATRWGLDREDSSVPIYLSWLHEDRHSVNATVNNKCGLVISTSYPWLAATPDGWVNDPTATPCQGLVEFKNPYAYRNLTLEDTITTKK